MSERTTSAAILGSSSTAINFRHRGSARIVRFPVPGPTSRTVSVGCMKAFCTIAFPTVSPPTDSIFEPYKSRGMGNLTSETPGFFNMC
jgi:hypothetical protein